MLKNKCCLYVIISIRFFSITICNLLIEFPSYYSGDQIEKNEMGGPCSTYWDERKWAYRFLIGKLEGTRPLGKPRPGCEGIISMDLQEVGWGALTGLIWLRVETGGGHLLKRWWTYRFHTLRGISRLTKNLLRSCSRGTLVRGVG